MLMRTRKTTRGHNSRLFPVFKLRGKSAKVRPEGEVGGNCTDIKSGPTSAVYGRMRVSAYQIACFAPDPAPGAS